MATYSLLPFAILRQFDNSGKLLSGGKLYTYQAGTLNPKITFQNSTGSIAHSNPIILSASGTANVFLDYGNYDLVVKSSTGELIGTVEGIQGSGISTLSESVNQYPPINVALYEDLRNLKGGYGIVEVSGRSTIGDGGEGLFERVPGSLLTDDDGYILVTSTGDRYRRIANYLDPRWFGVVYSSNVDQGFSFGKAVDSSALNKLPIKVQGNMFFSSDFTITLNASIEMDGGMFVSTNNSAIQFNTGSLFKGSFRSFEGCDVSFFNLNEVKVSWFSEATDLQKLSRATSSMTIGKVIIDKTLTITDQSLTVPDTIEIEVIEGCLINMNASISSLIPLSIRMRKLFNPEYRQVFYISSNWQYFGSIDFGKRSMAPEEFGFAQYGSCIIPILSGNVILNKTQEYTDSITASSQTFIVSNLSITGTNRNSVINIYPILSGTNLIASNCGIKIPGSLSYTNANLINVLQYDFASTYTNLIATDCSLPFDKVTVANSNLAQVININGNPIYELDKRNWYVGKPTFIEPYIDDIKSAQILSTDSNGKIIPTSFESKPYIRGKSWTVDSVDLVTVSYTQSNYNWFFTPLRINYNSTTKIGDVIRFSTNNQTNTQKYWVSIWERGFSTLVCRAVSDMITPSTNNSLEFYYPYLASLDEKITIESSNDFFVGLCVRDIMSSSSFQTTGLNTYTNSLFYGPLKAVSANSPTVNESILITDTTPMSFLINHEYKQVD